MLPTEEPRSQRWIETASNPPQELLTSDTKQRETDRVRADRTCVHFGQLCGELSSPGRDLGQRRAVKEAGSLLGRCKQSRGQRRSTTDRGETEIVTEALQRTAVAE